MVIVFDRIVIALSFNNIDNNKTHRFHNKKQVSNYIDLFNCATNVV